VHQSFLVGGGQPVRCLHADLEDFLDLQRTILLDALVQGYAGDKLHDQESVRAGFVHIVNRHHRRVADGRGSPGLADEALAGGVGAGQSGRQQFDGNLAMELVIEAFKNHAHAAAAQQLQHVVMPKPAERPGPG
jgi:hypothetical protein